MCRAQSTNVVTFESNLSIATIGNNNMADLESRRLEQ